MNIGLSLILLITATICDLKTGKIKNWITFPVIAFALIYNGFTNSYNILEMSVSLIAWFIIGCIGISGWGDIKCCMALTAINGWQCALNAYLAAQAFMVVKYLVLSPKRALSDLKENTNDILRNRVKIDTSKPKHIFAPFLLAGYLVHLLISFIINGGL